jgi:hypothetical protein
LPKNNLARTLHYRQSMTGLRPSQAPRKYLLSMCILSVVCSILLGISLGILVSHQNRRNAIWPGCGGAVLLFPLVRHWYRILATHCIASIEKFVRINGGEFHFDFSQPWSALWIFFDDATALYQGSIQVFHEQKLLEAIPLTRSMAHPSRRKANFYPIVWSRPADVNHLTRLRLRFELRRHELDEKPDGAVERVTLQVRGRR